MSKTIDERVVAMRFDNKQFEANVATSMSTLDKLKKSLDLDGAAKGFNGLSDAAKNCDMSTLGRSVEAVSTKFSALETIAVGALLNIGSKVADVGANLVKSLSVDQITAGWGKYAEKTASVQTIMNATGKSIDEVNGYLDRLMWFSDETSYGFTDMTAALAQMTSSGGDIDKLIPLITGVANATAFAGKGANEFSRVMYNLNQSYSKGYLDLMDWKSIDMAGASSKQLKQILIDTAVEMGKLKEGEVSLANFAETLKDKWADTSVLEASFGKFSAFSEKVRSLVDIGEYKTAGEAIQALSKDFENASKQAEAMVEAGQFSSVTEALRSMGIEYDEIAIKAFGAGQEAKSFSEAIDATKDAVSSSWMKTFEIIFGNYEEAKVLWTDLTDALWNAFAAGGDVRNDLLTEGLTEIGKSDVISFISDLTGMREDAVKTLQEIGQTSGYASDEFKELASSLAEGDEGIESAITHLLQMNESGQDVVSYISDLTGMTEESITALRKMGMETGYTSDEFKEFALTLAEGDEAMATTITNLLKANEMTGREFLIGALWNTWEGISNLLSSIKSAFQEIFPPATGERIYAFAKALYEASERLKELFKVVRDDDGNIVEMSETLTNLKNTFKGVFAVIDIVKQAFTALWRIISPGTSVVGGLLSKILGLTGSFGEWLSNLDATIKENDTFYNALKKVVDFIKGAITTVKEFGAALAEKLHLPSLEEAKESIKGFLNVLKERIGAPGMEFIHNLFERICVRAGQVRDAIKHMKDVIVDSFAKVDTAVSGNKFVQVLEGIWTVAKKVASTIGNLLGKAFEGVINALSNANFNGILDFLNALAAGGLIAAFKKFLDPINEMKDTFGSFIEWVKGIGSGVTKILDSVRGCLEAYQTKLKADAIGKIAAAIAVLAASLLVLSLIDSSKLASSVGAMTALFAELVGSMAILDKLSVDGKGVNKAATAMIKLGAALLIMSIALKNIAALEPDQMARGLAGIAGLAAVLVVAIVALESASRQFSISAKVMKDNFNAKSSQGAIKGLISFAIAIGLLTISLKAIAKEDWNGIAKGLVGITGMAAVLVVSIKALQKASDSYKDGSIKGLLTFAIAIDLLTISFKSIAKLDWNEVAKGLTGLSGMAVIMGGTIIALEAASSKYKEGSIKGLLSFAVSIGLLTIALKAIANEDWESLAKGLIGVAGLAAIMTVAIIALQKASQQFSVSSEDLFGSFNAKSQQGTIKGLIAFAAAIGILTIAFKAIAKEDWNGIAKGLTGITGLAAVMVGALTALTAVSSTFDDASMLKAAASILVMSGAVLVLTPAMKALGAMSWASIAKGLITIAGAFTIMGVAGTVLAPLASSILMLSGALALIGVGVVGVGAGLVLIGAGLTSISVGLTALAAALASSVTIIVSGLSAIILGIAALIPAIAEKIGEAIVAFCGVITNGAPAIGEAIKAVVLTLVDVLVQCIPAIADGALQLVTGLLNALVTYTPQIIDAVMQFLIEILEGIARNMPQLIQAAMDVLASFFSGVLSALGNIDVDTLIKGIGAVGLLTGLVAALGLIAGLIPSAMVGVLGLGAVIAELAIVLAAVGGLAQIPGLEWLISEGGRLLETIGTAIGGFVGGIVGGFMSGVSGSFPQIGADLSAFMTNVQPFIDGAQSIGPELLTGIANLTGAILLITAADLLEGLTSWLTGGSSLADFGNELVPFGEAMVKFSNTISDLDADLVDKAATAGKTLAEMAATLPNSGGVVGFFTGENDMGEFGEQLVVFGGAMMNFAETVKGLDADAVQNAATAGKAMAEMAATLPNTGGAVAFFAGDNDMKTFGEQLVPFGSAIKEYSEAVKGLDVDAVTNSAIAGKAMVELANTVPNTGGAVAFFAGDNDLATFGTQLVTFGNAMKEYSLAVTGLDTEAVSNSATAGAALVELANTIPNTGGLVSFFTGDNDLATFGEQLVPFGTAMKGYSDAITGIDTEAVAASTTAAQALAELQASLPNVGGVVEFFTGGNDLGTFGSGIKTFGDAMKSYGEAVAGMDTEAVTASATAAQALAQLQASLPNVGGIVSFFTGDNDLGKFAEGLIPFGNAMKSYGAAVAGINSDAITASATAAQSLATLQATLPNVGGVMEFFTGGNDLGKFSEGLVPFGAAMKSYSDAVTGINADAIVSSATAAKSLAELQAVLPNVGGVMEFFTGGNDLGTFAAGIIPFGAAMKSYGESVTGIDAEAITASAIAAQSLAELQGTLPKIGGVMEFFTGGQDLAAFGAAIVPFGQAMNSYSASVSGIDAGAVQNSATAGKALVELANTLPKCGGLSEVFTGSSSLSSFGKELVQFGKDLSSYSNAIKDVKPEVVTASANAAQALSNLATGLPSVSLFDQWFGGSNTLETFGKQIKSFGDDMGYYYSKIGNVDSGKLSAVVTQIWSIVDIAKGVQGLNTTGLSGFGKALKSMADSGITEFVNAFSDSKNKVNNAVKGMLDSVSSSISSNKTSASKGMQDVMTALATVVTKQATEINTSVTKMMTGVSNTIRNNANSAKSAMQTVMGGALNAITSYSSQFYTAGANVGQGFVNGINSKLSASTAAGRALGLAALNAAKKALDSHSPSREFIHLGENMGEGLAIGAKNSIVPASQATLKLIDEVLKVSNNGIDAFEKWASERKYYGELSLMEELAGWENLQKKYAAGTEERIKADREVYRIQNELVSSTYQASLNWIEQEKYYKRLSTEEELAAYERMQKRYLEGSKERMEIDKKVFALRNQLTEESYQHSMDWIENEKYYNRMSLSDELAAYKRVQSRYAKGTEERKKMDREVYRVEKEIYEAQQKYIEDVQEVQRNANEKRASLEQEYADKVKSINEKLASDIKSVNDKYQSALESRTNSLYQSYGLFDAVKEREEVSSETLMKNLEGQVQEFGEWQDMLDSLSARGLDSGLIEELQQMGPSSISQIKALTTMSDSELDKYAALWSIKHAQAREQAVGELEGLRIETYNNIVQLRIDADNELSEYQAVWQSRMDQVTIDANAELDKLRKDFGEKVGLIKKDTEKETQEMVDAAQKILEEAGWDETGKQIVTGLTSGVEEEKPGFIDALTQMALEGVEAVKDTLEIKSPSRVFRELGNFTGLGFVKGLEDYADKSYDAGSAMADSAKDGLSNAIQTVADFASGDMEFQPTIRPVLDLSDVANGADAVNSLFYNQRMLALAGQTSLAFSANAGDNDMTIMVDNDGVVKAITSLRGDVSDLSEAIRKMQIVLDTGVMVGAMAGPIDDALGQRVVYRGRGI